MYPCLVLVVFSKMRALNACLATTPLSVYLISDLHELHIYAGWIIMVDATIHTSFHLSRWFAQSNLSLLWTHHTGISGLITILCCLVIVLPITDFPFITLKKGTKDEKMISFRRLISYEFRKTTHIILFWGMYIVLTFHAPLLTVLNAGFCGFVFSAIALAYAIDCGVCYFVYVEMIPTMSFQHIFHDAVQLSFQPTQRCDTYEPRMIDVTEKAE